jgi:hypothetical protein
MTARTNLVKSSLLALGLGAALSASSDANAQTIVFTGGGSSAMLGTFNKSVTVSGNPVPYATTPALGAIPFTIVGFPGNIPGYTDTGATAQGIITGQVVISGESGYASTGATDALVLYSSSDGAAAHTTIIVLVRSDSGYGVRYVSNKESITDFQPFTVNSSGSSITPAYGYYTYATSPGARTSTALDASVITAVKSAGRVYNGLSDVGADTVATYSGFPSLTLSGLTGATKYLLPIQTLVFMYNSNHALGNITRSQAKTLIGGFPGDASGNNGITWGQILGAGSANPEFVNAYYRESTSGTRMTELLDVQRSSVKLKLESGPANFTSIVAEDALGLGLSPFNSAPGKNYAVSSLGDANGTGDMVNAVNNDPNGFGYAFITGTAGAGKANVEVASYDGVHPLDTAKFPVLSDGGQALPTYALSATSYYKPIIYGGYELWSYANLIGAPDSTQSTVAQAIETLLDSTLTEQQVHSLGFTRVSDMMAGRIATQGLTVTDDIVTDGQLISFDPSATFNTSNTSYPVSASTSLAFGDSSNNFGSTVSVLQHLIQ